MLICNKMQWMYSHVPFSSYKHLYKIILSAASTLSFSVQISHSSSLSDHSKVISTLWSTALLTTVRRNNRLQEIHQIHHTDLHTYDRDTPDRLFQHYAVRCEGWRNITDRWSTSVHQWFQELNSWLCASSFLFFPRTSLSDLDLPMSFKTPITVRTLTPAYCSPAHRFRALLQYMHTYCQYAQKFWHIERWRRKSDQVLTLPFVA